MDNILTNPSVPELMAATEANYLAYFAGSACLPRCEYHVEAQFTWFVAGGPPGNTVLHTQLESAQAPQQIAAMLQRIAQHDTSGWWQVLPSCRPVDLARHLLHAGLFPTESRPVMTADLTVLAATEALPPGARLERVANEVMLHDWFAASAAGFGASLAETQTYFDAYACLGFAPDAPCQHYIGYAGDQPVASSTLLLAGELAGIYDVSTIPAVRYQGWGRAVTRLPLLAARDRGYRYGTLQASHEGYHLYQSLGFIELYSEENYLWQRAE